jgi:hypothetical protein
VFVSIYGVQWLSNVITKKMAGLEAKETPQTHYYVMVTLFGGAVLTIDELKTPMSSIMLMMRNALNAILCSDSQLSKCSGS